MAFAATGHVLRRAENHVVQLFSLFAENHVSPRRRSRGVHVDDRVRQSLDRLVRPFDQIRTRGGEYDDGDVVGNEIEPHQVANEIEIGLTRRGIADLDFLVADRHHQFEHSALAFGVHRFCEGLITVTQIDGHPQGRRGGAIGRPRSVEGRNVDAIPRGAIALGRHG